MAGTNSLEKQARSDQSDGRLKHRKVLHQKPRGVQRGVRPVKLRPVSKETTKLSSLISVKSCSSKDPETRSDFRHNSLNSALDNVFPGEDRLGADAISGAAKSVISAPLRPVQNTSGERRVLTFRSPAGRSQLWPVGEGTWTSGVSCAPETTNSRKLVNP